VEVIKDLYRLNIKRNSEGMSFYSAVKQNVEVIKDLYRLNIKRNSEGMSFYSAAKQNVADIDEICLKFE